MTGWLIDPAAIKPDTLMPKLGLTEAEAHQVLKIIRAVNERGVSIIWIEHLMAMMEGVDRILALDQGRHLMCGAPGDVMSSDAVVACYMGVEEET
jgi:branched-chain amino acid transport system ATP-binding protein